MGQKMSSGKGGRWERVETFTKRRGGTVFGLQGQDSGRLGGAAQGNRYGSASWHARDSIVFLLAFSVLVGSVQLSLGLVP